MEENVRVVQRVTRLLRVSRAVDGGIAQQEVDVKDAIADTSSSLLRWAEAAAAPPNERKIFPTELLDACRGYAEALATADPERFASDCQSLAPPVAAALLLNTAHASPYQASSGASVSFLASAGIGGRVASPAPTEAMMGAQQPVGGIKEIKTLELWMEMLGLCLLPFCDGGGVEDGRLLEGLDGSDDGTDDGEDDSEPEDDEGGIGGDRPEAGRGGWRVLWQARGAWTESPECPFDVRPGGEKEDLPCRLATAVASLVKTAAAASVPSSTAVLAILCAFTTANGCSPEIHELVAKEAFSSLISVARIAPENSAQAECIKVALVSLRECVQATRLSTLEGWVPSALSTLETVPSRLKKLLTRSRGEGPKTYATARSFCREALAAAVACARALIRRAGASVLAADPLWFLRDFVVAMASPLLLADAVKALHAASEGSPGQDGEQGEVTHALRNVVLPGAVDRVTKALGNLERYSAGAAKEVLRAVAQLVRAASGEILPHRNRLGVAIVRCATSGGRGRSRAGVEADENLRLCLRAIRGMLSASSEDAKKKGVETSPDAAQPFAEAALDVAVSVVEREWGGGAKTRGDRGGTKDGSGMGSDGESIAVIVEAHATLVDLLRSDLRVPALDPDGEWPSQAKRLAKVAWAFSDRLQEAAGGAGAMRSPLADDDVILLCQGAEVLEALANRGGDFFQGGERFSFFTGELAQVLTTLRDTQGDDINTALHPVILDACAWVRRDSLVL